MFNRPFNRNKFARRGPQKWGGGGRPNNHRFSSNNQPRPESSHYVHKATPETEEVYQPVHTFADFALNEQLKKNIVTRGYVAPTPIQDQAIPHILTGRDVVGIANTGTGKTAAFLLPILNKIIANSQERVLIIVPTRELAVQIDDEFRAFAKFLSIYSALCIGGANMERQIVRVRSNPNVIIGTPGRLKDLIERRVLRLDTFRTIVLDEVDRMVDIGFIHDIRQIISLLPRERQSLFFSATVSPEINSIMQTFLKDPITVSVKKQATARSVDQDVIRVKSKEEKISKLNELLKLPEYNKVLIFGRTKWNVDRLAKQLERSGFSVVSIHGNKSQNQRLRALSTFKESRVQVMVATDIAARGLDIESVSHVINFDEPDTYDNYVHRIGRTGRANKQGKAITFVL